MKLEFTAALVLLVVVGAARIEARWFGLPRCPSGEYPCGGLFGGCYNPDLESGEKCQGGKVVCGFGFRACGSNCIREGTPCNEKEKCKWFEVKCGDRCIDTYAGQSCTSSVNVCEVDEAACGKFCYNKLTQKCYPGDLICGCDEEPCFGISCYNASKGQKCFDKGLICEHYEVSVNGRCQRI